MLSHPVPNSFLHACACTLSPVRLFATHELGPGGLLCLWNFPAKNTEAGCHFLLQRMFPTQGLNLRLLRLLHCRQILYVEPPGKCKLHVYICLLHIYKYCCCSVAKLCLTLCNPVDCSTPGFTVHHQLPELVHGFMSIESVMPSNHLILCCPLLHLLSIFPNIGAFSSELALPTRWPKYWSFGFSISP